MRFHWSNTARGAVGNKRRIGPVKRETRLYICRCIFGAHYYN